MLLEWLSCYEGCSCRAIKWSGKLEDSDETINLGQPKNPKWRHHRRRPIATAGRGLPLPSRLKITLYSYMVARRRIRRIVNLKEYEVRDQCEYFAAAQKASNNVPNVRQRNRE